MKHKLDDLLTYGRSLLENTLQSGVMVGDTKVEIFVDYKMILMSNYVAKRAIELAGRPVEIGFMYGGYTTQNGNKAKIKIDDFYVPIEQRISHVDFVSSHSSVTNGQWYFAHRGKRAVAIGHSHADFNVFHSNVDIDSYKRQVMHFGSKIAHSQNTNVPVAKTYESFSKRLKRNFTFVKPASVISSRVLPSLVYNSFGQFVDSKIAISSTYLQNGEYKNHYETKDCFLTIYNKQETLTSAEKTMLDHSIRRVLAYNGMLKPAQFFASDLSPKKESLIAS